MGLEERCEKGYKTHPTQKTKKMYGKTYRNCIKAEGEELEEKKDDRCTRIAKRKYDVWPSAYASGAVVRCRDGKIWKGVKESVEVSDLEIKIRQALHDEGGAAGIEGLVKKVGLIATLQNIKTERKLDISLVDEAPARSDPNTLLAVLPPLRVNQGAKVRSGARKQQKRH